MTRIALFAGLATAATLALGTVSAQAAPFSPTAPLSVHANSVEQVSYRGHYYRRPVVVLPFWRGHHRHHGYRHW